MGVHAGHRHDGGKERKRGPSNRRVRDGPRGSVCVVGGR
jgi:hypothetical protein